MPFNRKSKRKLNKLVGGMDKDERYHLIMAAQQEAVQKTMKELAPEAVLMGAESAYIVLFETFLEKISKGEATDDEAKASIEKMINHIGTEYLKAKVRREQEQARVKLQNEKVEELYKDEN